MATAETRRITAAYKQRAQSISDELDRQLGVAWRSFDPSDVARSWPTLSKVVAQLVGRGYGASQALAVAYLRSHAFAAGVDLAPLVGPSINLAQIDTSLTVTGPVAFKTAVAAGQAPEVAANLALVQLTGAATRLAQLGGRSTIDRTVHESKVIVGYRRETRAHSCYFCAMLASRGSVYKSKESATVRDARGGGSKRFHDHCHCTTEPLYGHQDEPAHVADLSARWTEVTAGKSGDDAVNAWRAAYAA